MFLVVVLLIQILVVTLHTTPWVLRKFRFFHSVYLNALRKSHYNLHDTTPFEYLFKKWVVLNQQEVKFSESDGK
jgi:hypothetical protein